MRKRETKALKLGLSSDSHFFFVATPGIEPGSKV